MATLKASLRRRQCERRRGGQAGDQDAQRKLPPGTRTYQVQPGDTLASIARKFYKSKERAKDIQDANLNAVPQSAKAQAGPDARSFPELRSAGRAAPKGAGFSSWLVTMTGSALANAATAVSSASGWKGLEKCIWKPAANAVRPILRAHERGQRNRGEGPPFDLRGLPQAAHQAIAVLTGHGDVADQHVGRPSRSVASAAARSPPRAPRRGRALSRRTSTRRESGSSSTTSTRTICPARATRSEPAAFRAAGMAGDRSLAACTA